MAKTYKKIVGLFGLLVVGALTIFAAFLPSPDALANSFVGDAIVVRVAGVQPKVAITNPASGSNIAEPNQTISYNYENVDDVKVVIEYTDKDGNTYSEQLGNITGTGYQPGSGQVNINLDGPNFGYGKYTAKVSGLSNSNMLVEDTVSFEYYPVTITVEEDENTGKVEATLDYNENNDEIKEIVIRVYDEKGNLTEIPAITVYPPQKRAEIPFHLYDLPAGKYIIEATAYSKSGNVMYKAYEYFFIYRKILVPNTGGFFGQLNISRTDYLITGLVVFLTVGVVGAYTVSRRKDSRKR